MVSYIHKFSNVYQVSKKRGGGKHYRELKLTKEKDEKKSHLILPTPYFFLVQLTIKKMLF
jgi:hypothetical protein